jgi:hypothetical protein
MDGQAATKANGRALKRLVTLLLSLAGLAHRASDRSAPVRFLVHFVVARAEIAVIGLCGVPAEAARPGTPVLPGPSDLLLLSARLSALALLLAQACGTRQRTGDERPVLAAVLTVLAVLPLPLLLTPFHDTS